MRLNKIGRKIPSGLFVVIALTLLSWGLFIAICGENPFNVFRLIVTGAFGRTDKIYAVINKIFIFFFTSLAYSIPAWSGMYNVGADGQLTIGAFASALIPLFFNTGFRPANILVALLAASIAGGLWALWPAVLRVRYNISEIVTTLLGSYLIITFLDYFANFPLREKYAALPRLPFIPENYKFYVFGESSLSVTILLALVVLSVVEFYRRHTISGFRLKMTGLNAFLAESSGIRIGSYRIWSMFIGGMFAGLTGGLLVLSLNFTFMAGFSADYGMNGMLVSLISGNIPWIAFGVTTIFAILQVGAINMQVHTSIPSEIVGVLQSIIVFFFAARATLSLKVRVRRSPTSDVAAGRTSKEKANRRSPSQ